MRITIERKIDDLTTEMFYFWLNDLVLILDSYIVVKRKTKRHKGEILKKYDRLRGRESTLSETDVPFTEEIKQQAIEYVTSKLSVKLWSELCK